MLDVKETEIHRTIQRTHMDYGKYLKSILIHSIYVFCIEKERVKEYSKVSKTLCN